jgi:hypothetical protein
LLLLEAAVELSEMVAAVAVEGIEQAQVLLVVVHLLSLL